MRRRIVEASFTTLEGFHALVVFNDMGHRCGYIGVPHNHFSAHRAPDSLYHIDVHGGVTFCDSIHLEGAHPSLWYIGFDCNHMEDAQDVDSMYKYGISPLPYHVQSSVATIRTLNFCIDQCNLLSAQLDKIELFI